MAKMTRREKQEYERALQRRKQMQNRTRSKRSRYDSDYEEYKAGSYRRPYDGYAEEFYEYEYEDEAAARRKRRRRMPEDIDARYQIKGKNPKPKREKGRKKADKGGKRYGKAMLYLQLASTAVFLAAALYLGMLPGMYLAVASLIALLFALGVYRMQNGKKKKRLTGNLIGLFLCICLLGSSYYMWQIKGALSDITSGAETTSMDEIARTIDVANKPFSVYISGIDVYGDITTTSRSDVNIIATVNPNTKEVLLVTTPRDYYIEIPGVTNGYRDKLTHAGTYGIDKSMAALANVYEMEIPFFIRVNFTSLIEMVDILGGIDVESELAFTTGPESGLEMEVKEGRNHFNGKEALAFCRERHALADGDNQRGKNQQAVIEAMIKKAMSPAILIKGPQIISRAGQNIETNMTNQQIRNFVKKQLTGMDGWKVTSVAADGTGGKKYCYSYSAGPLYVTIPSEHSVSYIRELVNAAEQGERISETVSK